MIHVVIPVYIYDHISGVVNDLLDERDLCWIYVVDNGGQWYEDWARAGADVAVIQPGENLRWTKGTNVGIRHALQFAEDGDLFLLLNDDVRLSRGFLAGLLAAYAANGEGIYGPAYDDVWPHQRTYTGHARNYIPKEIDREVEFVDGTALLVSKEIVDTIGILDEEMFGETGWGGDFDYCLRAKDAGYPIYVTERSFLNHFHQGTAKIISANWNGVASVELNTGMERKYGPEWRKRVGI